MVGICTSPYPIEKVGDSLYSYLVNAEISCQNGNGFKQYPRGDEFIYHL